MTVSVVLLQYNLHRLTLTALKSVLESDLHPEEILIVDNGSQPKEKEQISRHLEPTLRLIELPQNLGYVKGTNAGWKEATGDYIVLCNNDIALSRQCLRRLKLGMDQYPDLGWLCASYTQGDWAHCIVSPPSEVAETLQASGGRSRESFNQWTEGLGDSPKIVYATNTEATVFMVRKSLSDQIGYFWDELVWHQDFDYAIRVRQAGYQVAVSRNAVFWHARGHPTVKLAEGDGSLQAYREPLTRSDQLMLDKYGPNWRYNPRYQDQGHHKL